jgi:regulator of sigma E protease
MGILVFIVVIVALILVHEFGHFIVAKLSGMRVDEFGLGYPPRAMLIGKKGETEYTLNWLPFGGFVKIYGEDGTEGGPPDPRAFGARPRILQALVLVAGVSMNLLFAYVLITGALIVGTPRALSEDELSRATHVELAVAGVLADSPASRAGLVPGDLILSASKASGTWDAAAASGSFSDFVAASAGEPVSLIVKHNEREETLVVAPATGINTADPERYALGIEVAPIGTLPMSLGTALVEGARFTWGATRLTAEGLWHFFYGLAVGNADLSQVAGPVGIAGVVGGASRDGFGDLLSIMAIISINLALINLVPIPALDGGRLLVVLIEGTIRRRVSPAFTQAATAASFALLILLMLLVTAHDIYRIAT